MDYFSVLNYQGSKKNLIEFIHQYAAPYLEEGETVLDIFAGTCSVGYSYKRTNPVFANDSEGYSYIISRALLGDYRGQEVEPLLQCLLQAYRQNESRFAAGHIIAREKEKELLEKGNTAELAKFYQQLSTIWNGGIAITSKHQNYDLFTTYFAASYFGVGQAMEIDSIRYGVEQFAEEELRCAMLTALFFAMKECVFSKDGHMAQPLDPIKNQVKLLKQRKKLVWHFFEQKLREFFTDSFVQPHFQNRVFQGDFSRLFDNREVQRQVQFIYADPPYTDMQYSRYYHLLNIAANYDYPKPTVLAGSYTKGLYTEGRFQSKLSNRSTCLNSFRPLIEFSKNYEKNLAISFAYPRDRQNQKLDRYVMPVDELIEECARVFGQRQVEVVHKDYTHSNNRNSESKKVLEYLILCRGR